MTIRLTLVSPHPQLNRECESNQELRIGRSRDMDIALDVSSVSRFHAIIRATENGYCFIDQGSTNGSFINGIRLSPMQEHPLRIRNIVQIASVAWVVSQLNDERIDEHFVCEIRRASRLDCLDASSMLWEYERMEESRRFQLFAVACCRQVAATLNLETQRVFEECERLIDQDRRTQESGLAALVTNLHPSIRQVLSVRNPERMAELATRLLAESVAAYLVREIFINPSIPIPTIDPHWLAWNNATVLKLARTIYDDRRFNIMPILGDALEAAGCTNVALLKHCRKKSLHVRGCWALDLILGHD